MGSIVLPSSIWVDGTPYVVTSGQIGEKPIEMPLTLPITWMDGTPRRQDINALNDQVFSELKASRIISRLGIAVLRAEKAMLNLQAAFPLLTRENSFNFYKCRVEFCVRDYRIGQLILACNQFSAIISRKEQIASIKFDLDILTNYCDSFFMEK